MNQHTPNPDAIRLGRIAARWDAARGDVDLVYGDGEPHLRSGETFILAFGPEAGHDDTQFYYWAHPDIGFLLTLVERAKRRIAELTNSTSGNYAAECAMKCAEPAFLRYLTDRHLLPEAHSDEDVKVCVRKALDIKSRKQLNTNSAAARRWRDMCNDFELWGRHG